VPSVASREEPGDRGELDGSAYYARVALSDDDRNARRRQRHRTVRRRRAIGLVAVLVVGGSATAWASLGGDETPRTQDAIEPTPVPTPAPVEIAPAPTPPPAPVAAPTDTTITLAAVGDIVMGSPPYGLPPDGGRSFFSQVDELLDGDVVLGNLEGTLATGGSSKCGSGSPNCFAFRTPPPYGRWLRQAGFTVMNLANNHAFDFGESGQRETLAALNRYKLLHTGRPGEVATPTVKGVRVATLGFAAYKWANSLTDIPTARRLVREAAANADVVVVTMHAGAEGSDKTHVRPGSEVFLGEPRGDSMAFSRAVVDEGADLVLGHGPHVMRGMEFHKGRLIAYSMGNFAGYEVFGLGGTLSTSGVLQVTLGADGRFIKGRLRPTQIVEPGLPAPGGSGVTLVSRLSREDFGAKAARIAANGTIRPPRPR
jgi:poly-gamma-glutamate capsule biosynthesis protein CapA/YwtB (metallophosphatase superfamily)